MYKKYGRFALGFAVGMSLGTFRACGPEEGEAEPEPDESDDGTGMLPVEHEDTQRATPTAIVATSSRRIKTSEVHVRNISHSVQVRNV
jgi:hypothetical protein